MSREEITSERRRSSGGHRGEIAKDGSRHKERRNREARHEYDEESLRSPSRGSLQGDGEPTTPKRSHNLLKAAAAGAAGAALAKGVTSAMAGDDDVSGSPDRRQRDRRRRRAEVSAPHGFGHNRYADEFEDEADLPAPPMPLMSDINPSELTRTSILSAESDRPHSATEELASTRDVNVERAYGTSTPTRSKDAGQQAVTMQHPNISHGDLTSLPRGNREFVEEYETDEFGRKVPVGRYLDYENGRDVSNPAEYAEDDFEERYYSTQDVPAPLNYVPYQAGARGLSPIPSVSGYTEAGSEAPLPQASMEMPSPGKSPGRHRGHLSMTSNDSVPVGGVLDRDFEQDSTDGRDQKFDETAGGHAVRGIGANPNIVHPVTGVESAVASLVDGSMLEQSVLTGDSGQRDYEAGRDSMVSFDDELSKPYDAREVSPEPMDVDEERRTTPGSRSLANSQDYSEKELDEYGRKVPKPRQRHSPSASEAAITAGAVGAAAAALKAAKERRQAAADAGYVDFQPAGVARNRSFKERTMQHGWEPRTTPTHSVDNFDADDRPRLGASGIPDMDDPMPEIGYVDDELQTNPSVIEERLDGGMPADREWSGKATPTPRNPDGYGATGEVTEGTNYNHSRGNGLGITEAVGAAALGAAAGMAATREHTKTPEQDEWRRTSDERKRDTLITNPYEDASPIANPELDDDLLGARGLEGPFDTTSPGAAYGQKFDDDYISNGANRTPEAQPKGKGVNFGPSAAAEEDPFYSAAPKGHDRHLSGMSQGMQSPFYDASTGNGMERIENKDIVALMQHVSTRHVFPSPLLLTTTSSWSATPNEALGIPKLLLCS